MSKLNWSWSDETHCFSAESRATAKWLIGIAPGCWALYAPNKDAYVEQTVMATDDRVVEGPDALKGVAQALQDTLDLAYSSHNTQGESE